MTTVRPATPEDAPIIMGLIRELAEFEKYPEGVKITEETLKKDLEREACVAQLLWEGEECAAMVLYYFAYSTWEGQFINMEDLYVRPQHRRKGYGKILWAKLGQIAKERGCARLQWNVLNWNKAAIEFYKTMPCQDLGESEGWLIYRLNADGIKQLAESHK